MDWIENEIDRGCEGCGVYVFRGNVFLVLDVMRGNKYNLIGVVIKKGGCVEGKMFGGVEGKLLCRNDCKRNYYMK